MQLQGAYGQGRDKMTKEKKYELCFVLGESHSEEEAKEVASKVRKIIENRGGKVEKDYFWGKKKLAYPIAKSLFGYYFILIFSSNPESIVKITKDLNLKEKVIRYLITEFIEKTSFWEEQEEKEKKKAKKRKDKKDEGTQKAVKEEIAEEKIEEEKETKEEEKEEVEEEPKEEAKEVSKKMSEEERQKELDKKLAELLKEE